MRRSWPESNLGLVVSLAPVFIPWELRGEGCGGGEAPPGWAVAIWERRQRESQALCSSLAGLWGGISGLSSGSGFLSFLLSRLCGWTQDLHKVLMRSGSLLENPVWESS